MEKKCKSFDEFDFSEFEAKIGPLENDSERKAMTVFMESQDLFFKVLRYVYHGSQIDGSSDKAILKAFIRGFENYGGKKLDGAFIPDEVGLLRKMLITFEAMGYVRTDLYNEVVMVFSALDLGSVVCWLLDSGHYETWTQDESKTAEDVEKYLCKLLPPGQGEIYIFHMKDDYDCGLTEYQEELSSVAYDNISSHFGIWNHKDDGGTMLRFITKNY